MYKRDPPIPRALLVLAGIHCLVTLGGVYPQTPSQSTLVGWQGEVLAPAILPHGSSVLPITDHGGDGLYCYTHETGGGDGRGDPSDAHASAMIGIMQESIADWLAVSLWFHRRSKRLCGSAIMYLQSYAKLCCILFRNWVEVPLWNWVARPVLLLVFLVLRCLFRTISAVLRCAVACVRGVLLGMAVVVCSVVAPLWYLQALSRFLIVYAMTGLHVSSPLPVLCIFLLSKVHLPAAVMCLAVYAAVSIPTFIDNVYPSSACRRRCVKTLVYFVSPATVVFIGDVMLGHGVGAQWAGFTTVPRVVSLFYFAAAAFSDRFHFAPGVRCTVASYLHLLPLLISCPVHLHILCILAVVVAPHLAGSDDGSDLQVLGEFVSGHGQVRGAPHVPDGESVEVPADGLCLYHCMVAARDVAAWREMPLATRIDHAKALKESLMLALREKGDASIADRLSLSGPGGYPGMDEMGAFCKILGDISLLLTCDEGGPERSEPIKYGRDASLPLLHILKTVVRDGNGVEADHFNLLQSWYPVADPALDILGMSDIDVTDANAAGLKRRLNFRGAAESSVKFSGKWEDVRSKLSSWSSRTALPDAADAGVLHDYTVLYDELKRQNATWDDKQLRLAVGVLTLYTKRISSVVMIDHVALVWIMLGNRFLRAEDGRAYFYNIKTGSFEVYNGLLPDYLFAELRNTMMQLEGMLRSFNGKVPRTKEGICEAIVQSFAEHPSVEAALAQFVDNAIHNKGDAKLKSGGSAGGDGERRGKGKGGPAGAAAAVPVAPPVPPRAAAGADGDDDAGNIDLWYIFLAKGVDRVHAQLQSELLGTKLMQYIIEWCNMPSKKANAFAFLDCCYKFDTKGGNVEFLPTRSPDHDIYLGVPCKLLGPVDPVLDAAISRCEQIYQRTFWSNANAFEFCQANMEMARRGHNVDQITIMLGPGGVGLSLFTAHIAAMFGSLHRFFDPNIFYQDDELRKVVELLAGGIIFSGQERPTGTKSSLREDLLKKFCTAEGISGRLPYAILTKLVHIIGWKRIECNKMFKFDDISETNVESIVRRCAVVLIHARFFEKAFLEQHIQNPERYGCFARESDAKQFLTSGPAIVAGWKIQQVFAEEHSQSQIEDIIQRYTRCGGDNGVTQKVIRQACGLSAEAPSVGMSLGLDSTSSQEGAASAEQRILADAALHYSLQLLRTKQGGKFHGITVSIFNTLKLSPCASAANWKKEKLWEKLVGSEHLIEVSKDKYVPRIALKGSLSDLWNDANWSAEEEAQRTFTEKYDVGNFMASFLQCVERSVNLRLMIDCLEKALGRSSLNRTGGGKGRGTGRGFRKPKLSKSETDTINSRLEKLREYAQQLEVFTKITQDAIDGDGLPHPQPHPVKRRRFRVKCTDRSGDSQLSQQHATERVFAESTVQYRRTKPWRSRRIAVGQTSQGMNRILQEALLPHTADVDVVNCLFTLAHQIIPRLQLVNESSYENEIAIIKRLAENRQEACEKYLGVSEQEGKDVLLNVFNGQHVSGQFVANEFLNEVAIAGKFFRYVACTAHPVAVQNILASAGDKWLEASVASHMWMGVEDYILTTMVDACLEFARGHLSLHYDGFRVEPALMDALVESTPVSSLGHGVKTEDVFLSQMVARVKAETGYDIQLKVKEHNLFEELLQLNPAAVMNDLPPLFYNDGNCIPLSMCCLLGRRQEVLAKLNTEVVAPRTRDYRTWAEEFNCYLTPRFDVHLTDGSMWLVHCEKGGKPHCVAFSAVNQSQCNVFDGRGKFTMTRVRFSALLASAVDRKLMVFFEVSPQKPSVDPAVLSELLGLHAGASSSGVI